MMNINSKAVCAHVKSTLSLDCDNRDLQRWIGKLTSLNPSSFIAYTSELSELMAMCFKGEVLLTRETFNNIALRNNEDDVLIWGTDGNPYHPEVVPKEPVLKWAISLEHNEKSHWIWANLMKMKTAVEPRSGELSKTKMKEHQRSIEDPFNGDPESLNDIQSWVVLITRKLVRHSKIDPEIRFKHLLPVTHFPVNDKSLHGSVNNRPITKVRSSIDLFNLKDYLSCKEIQDLYDLNPTEFCSRVFIGTKLKTASLNLEREFPLSDYTPTFGQIAYIPNPAEKERVVDIPAVILQALSYPLGKLFKELNSSWTIQGVDSHENTCEYLHSLIKRNREQNLGLTFYSVDLSNFTDRLPYRGLTTVIADTLIALELITPFDRAILDLIAEGSIILNGKVSRYGVGNPMGTYPSFPSSSLANGIIATISYLKGHEIDSLRNVNLQDLPFRVIGDDIVIWDERTHYEYVQLLEKLGMPVQPTKCIQSPYVAEMCSKMISPYGVFQMRKLDKLYSLSNHDSLLDLYRYYGEAIKEHLGEYENQILETYSKYPEPYGLKSLDLLTPSETLVYNLHKLYNDVIGEPEISLSYKDWCLIQSRREVALPKSLTFVVDKGSNSEEPARSVPLELSLKQQISCSYEMLTQRCSNEDLEVQVSQLVLDITQLLSLTLSSYHMKRSVPDRHLVPDRPFSNQKALSRLESLSLEIESSLESSKQQFIEEVQALEETVKEKVSFFDTLNRIKSSSPNLDSSTKGENTNEHQEAKKDRSKDER